MSAAMERLGADTLFGRYTDYISSLFKPGIGVLAGNVFPYAGRNTVVQETRVFSPRVLNVFKFGYNWDSVFNTWEPASTSLANAIGLKLNQVPAEYGLPGVTLSGGYYAGGGTGINQGGVDNLAQFSDTLSWIKNRHHLSFGADIRIIHFDERLGLSNNGAFTFDGRYTGSSVADFLLGNFASASAQIGLGQGLWRSKSLNFFVQDDCKVSDRLTLNIGLRYDVQRGLRERNNNLNRGLCLTCEAFSQVTNPATAASLHLPLAPAALIPSADPLYSIIAATAPTPRSRGPPQV